MYQSPLCRRLSDGSTAMKHRPAVRALKTFNVLCGAGQPRELTRSPLSWRTHPELAGLAPHSVLADICVNPAPFVPKNRTANASWLRKLRASLLVHFRPSGWDTKFCNYMRNSSGIWRCFLLARQTLLTRHTHYGYSKMCNLARPLTRECGFIADLLNVASTCDITMNKSQIPTHSPRKTNFPCIFFAYFCAFFIIMRIFKLDILNLIK